MRSFLEEVLYGSEKQQTRRRDAWAKDADDRAKEANEQDAVELQMLVNMQAEIGTLQNNNLNVNNFQEDPKKKKSRFE